MYSIVVGFGAKHMDKLAASSAPLHDLALRYIGPWYGDLVDLAAVSALVAVVLAIHTANFRVLYSLGRDGLLPKALGRTHPRHNTPHVAIVTYSIGTLVVGLIAGAGWGPMAAFGNLGYLSSLGILPIFIVTNVALPVFMRRRHPAEFSVLLHAVFPALSTATFVAAIWLNIHPWPTSPLNVMPWLILAVVIVSAVWGTILKRRGSQALERIGHVLFLESEALPEAQDVLPNPEGLSPGAPIELAQTELA
jgi:amino acid transporter